MSEAHPPLGRERVNKNSRTNYQLVSFSQTLKLRTEDRHGLPLPRTLQRLTLSAFAIGLGFLHGNRGGDGLATARVDALTASPFRDSLGLSAVVSFLYKRGRRQTARFWDSRRSPF